MFVSLRTDLQALISVPEAIASEEDRILMAKVWHERESAKRLNLDK